MATIRIYTDLAELMMLSLEFLRYEGTEESNLRDWLYRRQRDGYYKGNSITNRVITRIIIGHPAMSRPPALEDRIAGLAEQLERVGAKENYADLIDRMVQILGLPHSKQVLGGKPFRALKRAILLPEEAAAFSEAALKKELYCIGCGRPFASGEISTFVTDREEHGFYCVRCVAPSVRPCPMCSTQEGATVPLPSSFGKILTSKGDCGKHGTDGAVVANTFAETETPVLNALRNAQEMARRRTEEVRVRGANPRPIRGAARNPFARLVEDIGQRGEAAIRDQVVADTAGPADWHIGPAPRDEQ